MLNFEWTDLEPELQFKVIDYLKSSLEYHSDPLLRKGLAVAISELEMWADNMYDVNLNAVQAVDQVGEDE